jgi:transposase
MVLEHQGEHSSQWRATRQEARRSPGSIAAKIGCTTETLRRRVREAEIDQGGGPALQAMNDSP